MDIKTHLREADILCRYGGDEFLAVLPRTHIKTAKDIADRLHQKLCGSVESDKRNYVISFSVGTASLTNKKQSLDDLISEADQTMYQDKSRNKVPPIKANMRRLA